MCLDQCRATAWEYFDRVQLVLSVFSHSATHWLVWILIRRFVCWHLSTFCWFFKLLSHSNSKQPPVEFISNCQSVWCLCLACLIGQYAANQKRQPSVQCIDMFWLFWRLFLAYLIAQSMESKHKDYRVLNDAGSTRQLLFNLLTQNNLPKSDLSLNWVATAMRDSKAVKTLKNKIQCQKKQPRSDRSENFVNFVTL